MKRFFLLVFALVLFFSLAKDAKASEGVAEIRNVIGGQSRCFATSVLMPDFNYNVLVTCRDLLYPVSSEVLTYIVWVTPVNNSDPVKLGELNFGKVEFKTKVSFSNIFVTQERDDNKNVKFPTGSIAMRGNLVPIQFLERTQSSSEPEATIAPTVTPIPKPSQAANTFKWLRTGGLITVVAIFIIVLMLVLIKPFK